MIPVWGLRYLPAGRGSYGHPVLSIYQADIIMFGTALAKYIAIEPFGWVHHPGLDPAGRLDPAADGAVLERLPDRRPWLVMSMAA